MLNTQESRERLSLSVSLRPQIVEGFWVKRGVGCPARLLVGFHGQRSRRRMRAGRRTVDCEARLAIGIARGRVFTNGRLRAPRSSTADKTRRRLHRRSPLSIERCIFARFASASSLEAGSERAALARVAPTRERFHQGNITGFLLRPKFRPRNPESGHRPQPSDDEIYRIAACKRTLLTCWNARTARPH